MARTALVTGGTGGLGVAVVEHLLARGWRVVVPWLAEHELERLPPRDGLSLVEADLLDSGSVARVAGQAAADSEAPLGAAVNLVGGFAQGGRGTLNCGQAQQQQPEAERAGHDDRRGE